MKLINFDLASRIFVKGISRISFLPPSETDDFRFFPLLICHMLENGFAWNIDWDREFNPELRNWGILEGKRGKEKKKRKKKEKEGKKRKGGKNGF